MSSVRPDGLLLYKRRQGSSVVDDRAGWKAEVVLIDGDVEVVVGHVASLRPDLAVVATLVRLQLVAGRLGYAIRIRHPSTELCGFLGFLGLTDVFARSDELGLEVGRKAEGGEQFHVQEVVERGDPPP